jgi:peptidoglycan hydrolase-like protein with peptidoglycan-binding domain
MRTISATFNPASRRNVKALHEALLYLGVDRQLDTADAALGPQTAAAVAQLLGGSRNRATIGAQEAETLNRLVLRKRLEQPAEVAAVHSKLDLAAKKGFLKTSVAKDEITRRTLGPTSREALIEFQRRYRLKPTGEMDPATDEKLLSLATSIIGSKPQPKAQLKIRRPETLTRVVNYLRLNMTGERIGELQKGLAWLGHSITAEEHRAGRFGRTTRDAVAAFQRTAGLPITGAVDGPTSRALNARLAIDAPQVATGKQARVRGSVRDETWRGVGGVRLRLRTLGTGKLLAERTTFRDGFFDLVYDPVAARSAAGVHLVLERLDAAGAVADSRTVYNAGHVAWTNFTEGEDRYAGPSTFEQIRAALVPVLAELKLNPEAMEESQRRRDFSFAARSTKMPADVLWKYAAAHRVARAIGDPAIGADLIFGFFLLDLPTELPGDPFPDQPEDWDETIAVLVPRLALGIGLLPDAVRDEAVRIAVKRNIVPRSLLPQIDALATHLAERRVDLTLSAPLLVGDGSLGAVLGRAAIGGDAARRVARTFSTMGGLSDAFWSALPDEGIAAPDAERLRRTVDVAAIARNHPPMMDALTRRNAIDAPRALAKMSRADWSALIDAEGIEPPPFADATDDSERADMYAASLHEQAQRLFPDVALVAEIRRRGPVNAIDTVAKVLDDHPTLDLASDNLTRFNAEVGGPLDADGLATARALQRVRRIAPSAEMGAALVEARLLGATDVVRAGETNVVNALSARGVAIADARHVMRRAESRHAGIVAKIAQFRFDFQKNNPAVIPSFLYSEAEIEEFRAEVPDIETLFGTLDYCDCPAALSLYSPAAYLADLLRFLSTKPARQPGTTVLDVLTSRRPEIVNIKLNQPNTEVPVPTIDLINEILEHAVPPVDLAFDLQTTRPAEELAAAPEHTRETAYDVLRAAQTPIHASLNLWQARTRAFLALAGAPRHEIMATLASGRGTAAQAPQEAEIAAEQFGIAARDLDRIAPAVAADSVALQTALWALDAGAGSVPVSLFMQRAGLDYGGVLALLDAAAVNGVEPRARISRPFDDCDVDRQTIVDLRPATLDLMHRFLRLQRHTVWQTWELDLLVRHPAVGAGRIDRAAVAALSSIRRLQDRFNVGVEDVLAFFGPLNTEARRTPDGDRTPVAPLYERVFLNPLVKRPVPASLVPPFAGGALAAARPDLLAPLQVGEEGLLRLEEATDGTLSEASLGTLYRWARFARLRGATVSDTMTIRALAGWPAAFATPAALEAALDTFDALGRPAAELQYLLEDRPQSHLAPREATVTAGLTVLIGRLAEIRAASTPGGGDTLRDVLAARLARRPDLSEADRTLTLDLIDGAWSGTEAERTALVERVFAPFAVIAGLVALLVPTAFDPAAELDAAAEAVVDTRRRAVLAALAAAEANDAVTQWTAERFGLAPAVARLLLERLPAGGGTAMAVLLDPALGDADPISAATLPEAFHLSERLHKIGLFLKPHDLEADTVAWLIDHGAVHGILSPADLPVGAAPAAPLLPAWRAFAALIGLRDAFPAPEGVSVFAILDRTRDPAASAMDVETLIALLTQREGGDIAALRPLLGISHGANVADRGYAQPAMLVRLATALSLLRRLGMPIEILAAFARRETEAEEAELSRRAQAAAQARFDPSAWLERLRGVEDSLREKRRDVLVAFLIDRSQRTEPPAEVVLGATVPNIRYFRNAADVTRYHLIDVEMSACQPSSRIRQAISAVQMFVQRCFLNREQQFVSIPDVDPDLQNNWAQWEWRKSYRIWEANRKVLFYPENWIEPELRDDKTPFFRELESDVLQNDLTAEQAEGAVRKYLEKLRDVADVEVTGVYYELPSPYTRLHVVARNRSAPHTHYYRYFDFDYDYWSPWERLDVDIVGQHAIPVVYNRRLHIFWLEIAEKPERVVKNPPAQMNTKSARNPEPAKVLEVKLCWTAKAKDGWSARRTSSQPLIHPWTRPHSSYHLRPRYKPADNSLWLDVFLSTSREFNDRTFLEQAGDAYSFSYRTRTRFNQSFRPWHSSSFVFDGAVKAVHLRPLYASYYYPDTDTTGLTSSWAYVRDNFGEDGRAIRPLSPAQRMPSAPRPLGMHHVYNRLGNNDAQEANAATLNISTSYYDTLSLLQAARAPFEVVAPILAGARPSMIYQDKARSFFVKAEWRDIYDGYTLNPQQPVYTFYPFTHPYADLFVRELNRLGIDGFLNREIQTRPETFYPPNTFDFGSYAPIAPHGPAPAAARDVVDFSFVGAYSIYNWELFFHIPFYLAIRLAENQKFDDAFRFFHKIFDPRSTDPLPSPQRYWITKPFFDHTAEDYRKQRVENLVQHVDEFSEAITAWANSPFNPHLVARYRPVAYQRAVVMRYLDTLIAQADQRYRQDTFEAIDEAALLYLLAAEIMGDPPIRVPALPRTDKSYAELAADGALDLLGNQDVLAGVDAVVGPAAGGQLPPVAQPPPIGDVILPYFCLPPNDRLTKYWETIGERLFNIRHCRTIGGVERVLALFAPPIDPALLVKAAAAGIDISTVAGAGSAPGTPYRFDTMVRLARQMTGEVQRLGERLLGALEKRDAEELSVIRATAVVTIQSLRREVLDLRMKEAAQEIVALEAGRAVAAERERFYRDRERMLGSETAALDLGWTSLGFEAAIAVGYTLAGGLALIPDFLLGGSGFGGSPHVVSNIFSGQKVSSSAENAVKTLSSYARALEKTASQMKVKAELQRRTEDWDNQATLAGLEATAIDARIVQAEIAKALAERERDKLEDELEAYALEETYLKTKYTQAALYSWMIGDASDVYFQAYALACDVARQAEKTFRRELGDPSAAFVGYGHWDSLRKGLGAGERLMGEINRMEAAYHERNRREFELTKHVSLAEVAPAALLALRFTGGCTVDLPEWLFDMDFPQHYFRRLKSVSLTIPAVVGPYATVNCTLTLVASRIRVSTQVGGQYEMQPNDTRFTSEPALVQSIATSRGQDDAGLFQLSFDDPRLLPFEGAGAISTWRLSLPPENNRFDLSSVSDVVMHLRYTAREGSTTLAAAARDAVDAILPKSGAALFSARRDFPDAFYRLAHPNAGAQNELVLNLVRQRFPFTVRDRPVVALSLDLFVIGQDGADYVARVAAPGEVAGVDVPVIADAVFGDAPHGRRDLPARPDGIGPWRLALRRDDAADFLGLSEDELTDVLILVAYELG